MTSQRNGGIKRLSNKEVECENRKAFNASLYSYVTVDSTVVQNVGKE